MLNFPIYVMSYKEAFDYVYNHSTLNNPPNSFAMISIREEEPEKTAFQYVPNGNLKDVLNIYFSDTEVPTHGCHLMSDADAARIKEFVERLVKRNQINFLIIHCYAGISRSAAVAAALEKLYNGDDSKYFLGDRYVPNRHVYKTMLNAYGLKNNGSSFKNI